MALRRATEPFARKLARWRATLSAIEDSDAVVLVVVAPPPANSFIDQGGVVQRQQYRQQWTNTTSHPCWPRPAATARSGPTPPPLFASVVGDGRLAAARGIGGTRAPPAARRAFASGPGPGGGREGAPAPRSPTRSGAGLGGGAGGGGSGPLASVIAAEAGRTRVNAYTPDGFVINQVQVDGPVLCLPETWLMWAVGDRKSVV